MHKTSRFLVALAFYGGAAGAPLAQEVTLSALNFLPNNHAVGRHFPEWIEAVNKEGKGLLRIELRPSGSMSPFTMGNAVKTGVVDMASNAPTFYQNLLPIGDALKLARKSPEEMRKNGAWELMNKLHNEKVNAWMLNSWGHGLGFHLYLRDRKIETPDIKGFKIRVTPVYRAFFKALGADLIQTAPGDVYTALERGTIDGYGWPTWDIKSVGWDKVTKYRVEPPFYIVSVATIINLDKWKSLNQKQQELLTRHAIRLENEFPKKADEGNARYRKEQAEAGVQVIEFKGKVAEDYVKLAYESAWAEFMQLDPVNTPALRKLIDQ
jgi:TRAP-type C4-dicarboxylate transport system substrate-binding protein